MLLVGLIPGTTAVAEAPFVTTVALVLMTGMIEIMTGRVTEIKSVE